MKSEEPDFGTMTLVMAMIFGLPLGTAVANSFSDASLVFRLSIMFPFFICGAVIGYQIDTDEKEKSETNDGKRQAEDA